AARLRGDGARDGDRRRRDLGRQGNGAARAGATRLIMRQLVLVSFGLGLVACGSSKAPPPPTPTGPPAAWLPTTAPDDVQVATVNGKPVWGSCVTAQAAHATSKQDALKQCIDFELLAQEANAHGIATDPDVALATRTALVSQV